MPKRKKVKKFTILFASDSNYAPHLATAIYSLLENNKDIAIQLAIFTSDMTSKDQGALRQIANNFNVKINFYKLNDNLFDGLILNHHFQKSNYYRLFAADLIEDQTCLYLDSDIIVNGSIKDLIKTKLNDYFLAAVECPPGFNRHKELMMKLSSKYFNSGVMLLNLDKWRQVGVKKRVIAFIKKKPQNIHFVDQCGLNSVIDGQWFELEQKYNFQVNKNHTNLNMEQNPIIVHFTGSSKPWHIRNENPYKKLYWQYRDQTVYQSYLKNDYYLIRVLSLIIPKFLKKVIKKNLRF